METIIISTIKNKTDNKPAKRSLSWWEFVAWLKNVTPRGKLTLAEYLVAPKPDRDAQKNGAAIICGFFSKAGTRHEVDIAALYLVVIDLDGGEHDFDTVARHLRESGLESLIHTSYSHSQELTKLRVYVLLKTPITGSAWEIRARLVAVIRHMKTLLPGARFDDCCEKPGQLWYLPSCPSDAVGLYRSEHIEGEPLDHEMLAAPSVIPPPPLILNQGGVDPFANLTPRGQFTIDDLKKDLGILNPDMTRNDGWLQTIMGAHHQFAGTDDEAEAIGLLEEWSSAGVNYKPDEIARMWPGLHNDPNRGKPTTYATVRMLADRQRSGEWQLSKVTDMRLAELFSNLFYNDVRYWAESKKYLTYDGRRFTTDREGSAFPFVKRMINQMYEEAKSIPDDAKRQDAIKKITGYETHARQEQLLRAVAVTPEVIVSSCQLDRDPMLLNVRNGTLDLATGVLRRHNPADLITRIVNVDYIHARCTEFMRFIERVLGGNRDLIGYLQRWVGYCLTGRIDEQVLLFLYGLGANGKTTLANILEILLGDYANTAGCSVLMHRNNRDATNDVARLRGARLIKVSEFDESERLDEATVKTLTGGDRITCRFLYGEHFEYTPEFKIMLLGNHKPKITGRDNGIWRRIHMLPFNVTIPEEERDPKLQDKLLEELPGILAWAVQGCLEWQNRGLSPPAEVRSAVAEYRHGEDIFRQWIDEACVTGPEYTSTPEALLESFKKYSGWRQVTPTKFGKMLGEAGYERRASGTRFWCGIRPLDGLDGFTPVLCKPREEDFPRDFTESGIQPVQPVQIPPW